MLAVDDDNLAVYLLDVSGHGVGAALLSVSILNALRSQTLSETEFKNPGEVLSALNGAFPGEKHDDMFFTIWYGVYTKSTRTLNYASGGHPPALLFSASKKQRFEMIPLRTKNNVIGAMPNVTYHNKKQLIQANSNLFICGCIPMQKIYVSKRILKMISLYWKLPLDNRQAIITF